MKLTNEGFEVGTFTGLWVDDERPIPEDLIEKGWTSARSFHEAVVKLELIQFTEVSLDHDIASFYGYKEMTGYDVLMWMVARKLEGGYVPSVVEVHTANFAVRQKMIDVAKQHFINHNK